MIIYSGAQLRQYAIADVEEDTLRSTQLGIMHYEELIDSAEQLLITLSQLPHIQSTDQHNCSALLSNLQPDFPQYTEISIITVDGTPLCSTEEEASAARYAQHPWFTRAVSSGEFTIGDFDINRDTGQAVLVFAYPLKDLEGRIHKLITASMDLAWLNNLALDAHLPSDSSVIMIDKNGTILAHYPNSEEWIGQALPDIVMLNNMLTTTVDTEVSDKLDGVRRFYAYQRIFDRTGAIEAVIGIGVPMTYVLNPVNQIINRILIGCIIALIASLIAVWIGGDFLFVKQMKTLLAATRRLAAGELTTRTGLAYRRNEIGELARGFDDMASSLENQENLFALAIQELRQSEVKFRTLAETSSAAISIYQKDRFIYVNSALSEITGYSQKELLGTSVWHMIAPEFEEKYKQAYQERQDGKSTATRFEMKLLTRNGTERWIDYSSAVIDHNGEPALLSTGFDITQRIITERAVEHTLDEILVLYEVAKAAFDAVNTDELISSTSQIIGERLFPQTFGVVLVDRKQGMLRFHPSYHTPTAGRQDPLPLLDGIISHVVNTGEAYYSANVEKDPHYFCGEPLTRSEICVPIWVAGEVFGAINAESSLPDAFSQEDLVLLNAIANQVGTAVQKIQLYESERRRREEAETLREASEMLTSSLELPEVLDSILEQLERVIPYDSTSVMLLDSGQTKVYASRG
ncbi:MAG TPA: PAS domain S-box protein, partial [Anaerolineaceae bacterium]|nr:PAS domain S-box protein [Anaerolineaceae bacterium]